MKKLTSDWKNKILLQIDKNLNLFHKLSKNEFSLWFVNFYLQWYDLSGRPGIVGLFPQFPG